MDIVERHFVHLRKQAEGQQFHLPVHTLSQQEKRVSLDLLQTAAHKGSAGVSSSEDFKPCRNPSEMNWVVEVSRG